MLKIPAGFDMEAHSHITTEQNFVLEGKYESGGKKFGVGTYQYIPDGSEYGLFTSEKGAIILVIWDPL